MKKILIVVDMQNDFIDGSLGTPEAEAIVDNVVAKINTYTKDCVYATRDTHQDNYLQTQEGENLPEECEIEIIGLCTDICVVSNALILKARLPEVKISVDASCCAGVKPESHAAALQTMQMCQIHVR